MPDERKIYFISDTHIRGADDPASVRVHSFLRTVILPEGEKADLYLLGDIVEFWVEYPDMALSYAFRLFAVLRACVEAGTRVFFIPGNRDFTFGKFLTEQVGVQICSDMEEVIIGGKRVLLTHGDLLCTDDVRYQKWRTFIRGKMAKHILRSLPTFLISSICRRLIKASKQEVSRKGLDLYKNVLETATDYVRQGTDIVICGHVHRALHRPILSDGHAGDLYTLGAWDHPVFGSYLVWDGNDFRLRRFYEDGHSTVDPTMEEN